MILMIDLFDKDSLKKESIMCIRCSAQWQERDCGPSIVDDISVYIVEIFYSWKHIGDLDGSILKDHLSLFVFSSNHQTQNPPLSTNSLLAANTTTFFK